jgi:glycosyltransferase involved in cell wall biosynthesis
VDVLQLHHSFPTAVGLAAAALAPRTRLIRTRYNLGYWLTPRGRRVERMASERSDLTVVNCAAARDALLAEAPAPRGGIVIAANGIEMATLLEIEAPEDSTPPNSPPARVGLVANLRPIKDPERFVEAAASLARRWPRAIFEIAGDGELREPLGRQAAALGIADRLTFHGAVADVAGFLRDLDVAVLCSRSEALPNALLEYMAAARPTVATAVGGVPEVVRDGSEALLVPAGDTPRLADAIDRLLADRALARRLALAARARAVERYSMAASTTAYCALWSTLVENVERPLRRRRGTTAMRQNEKLLRALSESEVVGVPDLDRAGGDTGPVEG